MKTLHLHIDRIVVEGLSPSDQRQFARSLEHELRQLGQSGIAGEFKGNTRRRIQSLQAGILKPGSRAPQAAAQIAAAIRSSLSARDKSNPGTASSGREGSPHV